MRVVNRFSGDAKDSSNVLLRNERSGRLLDVTSLRFDLMRNGMNFHEHRTHHFSHVDASEHA